MEGERGDAREGEGIRSEGIGAEGVRWFTVGSWREAQGEEGRQSGEGEGDRGKEKGEGGGWWSGGR